MKCLIIFAATLTLAAVGSAEDEKGLGDFGKRVTSLTKVQSYRSASGGASAIRQVLAKDVTIAARDVGFFEFPGDLSGIERVSISIGTFNDPKSTLKTARIGVAWAGFGDYYVLSDIVSGSSFAFIDHGGINLPAYGPGMKIAIYNDGTTPLIITQLSVYAVVH